MLYKNDDGIDDEESCYEDDRHVCNHGEKRLMWIIELYR